MVSGFNWATKVAISWSHLGLLQGWYIRYECLGHKKRTGRVLANDCMMGSALTVNCPLYGRRAKWLTLVFHGIWPEEKSLFCLIACHCPVCILFAADPVRRLHYWHLHQHCQTSLFDPCCLLYNYPFTSTTCQCPNPPIQLGLWYGVLAIPLQGLCVFWWDSHCVCMCLLMHTF